MTEETKTGVNIPSERLGLWVAVTFIIALLAFIASIVANFRLHDATVITQGEVLLLNNKIQALEQKMK